MGEYAYLVFSSLKTKSWQKYRDMLKASLMNTCERVKVAKIMPNYS